MPNRTKKRDTGLFLKKSKRNPNIKITNKKIRIVNRRHSKNKNRYSKRKTTGIWDDGKSLNRLNAEDLLKRLTEREITIKEASPLTRFLAFLIDLLIIDVIVISPFRRNFSVIESIRSASQLSSSAFAPEVYSSIITASLLIITYFVIFEFFFQQTPGKMLTGLFVETNKGKELSLTQCILKNIVFFPILPFVIWWFIDIYFIFKTKQRLTERLLRIRTMEKIVLR